MAICNLQTVLLLPPGVCTCVMVRSVRSSKYRWQNIIIITVPPSSHGARAGMTLQLLSRTVSVLGMFCDHSLSMQYVTLNIGRKENTINHHWCLKAILIKSRILIWLILTTYIYLLKGQMLLMLYLNNRISPTLDKLWYCRDPAVTAQCKRVSIIAKTFFTIYNHVT